MTGIDENLLSPAQWLTFRLTSRSSSMKPTWVTRTGEIHQINLLKKNTSESLQWDSVAAESALHSVVGCAWWWDEPTNPERVLFSWQKWGSLESAEDVCRRCHPPCRQLLRLCQLRIQLFLGSPKREDPGHCESKLYHQVSLNGIFFFTFHSQFCPRGCSRTWSCPRPTCHPKQKCNQQLLKGLPRYYVGLI